MKEKERYVYEEQENGYYFIYDNYEERYLNVVTNCKILNQQDKELIKLRASYQQVKEENSQLKKQLHDLPKKIVEEIEKCFTEYLPLKYRTGAWFYGKLNEILKKYGGEND